MKVYTPRPYQGRMTNFAMIKKDAAIFVDMGYGKTAAMLDTINKLFDSMEIKGVLVVAPINVIETVWPDEIDLWQNFRHLTYSKIRGKLTSQKRVVKLKLTHTKPNADALTALKKHADIYAINYENLASLCEWALTQKVLPFDTIILDESSKLKAQGSKRLKRLRTLLPRLDRHIILTGTPSPESLLDLFSQILCVDSGKALGRFFTNYRDRFFDYNPWTYKTTIRPGAEKQIRKLIQPMVFCLDQKDHLDLPKLLHNEIQVVLPDDIMRSYKTFEKELYAKLQDSEIEAVNAGVMSGRCRQLTSGAVYIVSETSNNDMRLGLGRPFDEFHSEKLDALETILDQSGNVIVMYEFKHELVRLLKRFPHAKHMGQKTDKATIANWQAGKIKLLLSHPNSLAHGLNLQTGGHTIVWLTLTWSQENYAQAVKRLHRPGQSHPVVSHRIIARDTIDSDVWSRIIGKHKTQADLLRALGRRIPQ